MHPIAWIESYRMTPRSWKLAYPFKSYAQNTKVFEIEKSRFFYPSCKLQSFSLQNFSAFHWICVITTTTFNTPRTGCNRSVFWKYICKQALLQKECSQNFRFTVSKYSNQHFCFDVTIDDQAKLKSKIWHQNCIPCIQKP